MKRIKPHTGNEFSGIQNHLFIKLLPTVIYIMLVWLSVFLAGCGVFDSTYIVESDYTLPAGNQTPREGEVNVKGLSELIEAIRSTVAVGSDSRTIIFDSGYEGSPSEDLASACWKVRTEDALCAYCVENIAYELNQIVTHTEAHLNISYSSKAIPISEIITMPYATELDETLSEAIGNGVDRLAVLISRSTLSSETMMARVEEVYRENPLLAPQEPVCTVTMFSGNGTQRLYELSLLNDLTPEEFSRRKAELDEVRIPNSDELDELSSVLAAAEFLSPRCVESAPGTVYAALVTGAAGPEGIALGNVALCRQLGIECQVVYGQKDWQDHCWNIVRIDGNYYHIDLFSAPETGLLKSDEEFWGNYRWNVNEYPKCEASFYQNQEEESDSNRDEGLNGELSENASEELSEDSGREPDENPVVTTEPETVSEQKIDVSQKFLDDKDSEPLEGDA